MKREAKIILPMVTNQGMPLEKVHTDLGKELTDRFGGATVSFGDLGLWAGPLGATAAEPVGVFLVAVDDTAEVKAEIAEIAERYGRRAGQHTMYVRHADGEVQFLALEAANDNIIEFPQDNAKPFMI